MKNKDQIIQKTDRPFMTIDEASKYLGISKSTLYQYTHKKVLNYYKIRGKLVYFRKSDLDQFILGNQNLVKSQEMLEREADSRIDRNR